MPQFHEFPADHQHFCKGDDKDHRARQGRTAERLGLE